MKVCGKNRLPPLISSVASCALVLTAQARVEVVGKDHTAEKNRINAYLGNE